MQSIKRSKIKPLKSSAFVKIIIIKIFKGTQLLLKFDMVLIPCHPCLFQSTVGYFRVILWCLRSNQRDLVSYPLRSTLKKWRDISRREKSQVKIFLLFLVGYEFYIISSLCLFLSSKWVLESNYQDATSYSPSTIKFSSIFSAPLKLLASQDFIEMQHERSIHVFSSLQQVIFSGPFKLLASQDFLEMQHGDQ